MNKVWTKSLISQLRFLYMTKSARECSEIMGFTFHQVKRALHVYNITGGGHKTIWTDENKEKLKLLYPDTLNSELAVIFGCEESLIQSQARKERVYKSAGFKRKHALKGMFKPGQVPPNKGQKMTQEQYERCRHTMFKKGSTPTNTKSDGEITIRPDKRGVLLRFIRISSGKWMHYARYVWEQKHGPVPKGMCVRHKDDDSLHDEESNLELISLKENRIRNSGSIRLTDRWVAFTIAGRNNPELITPLAAQKNLIELKRNLIKLKRQCRTQA